MLYIQAIKYQIEVPTYKESANVPFTNTNKQSMF